MIAWIGLLGVLAVVFGFSISLLSRRKVTASAGAKRVEGISTESPLLATSIILWGIIIIVVIAACGSLILFLAPDAALQARIFMVNQDRTIKPITSPELRFIHASGLLLFLAFLSFAAVLNRRPTLARNLIGNLFNDAQGFLLGRSVAVREWIAHDHGIEMISLAVVFLMAVAIRLFFLTQPMGWDEATTVVRFSSRTLLDVISDYSMPNNHIFHTVLVHMSTGLFGIAPVIVRLPAFLAGLMIVPVSFWLMRRLFDDNTAVLTAALTAVAPAMVEYSTQARGYTLLTLLFLIAFVNATYLREHSSITAWIIFIISVTLGFYTIPTMLYAFGVVALWLLFAAPQHRRKGLFVELTLASLAIAIGTLLLYLPVLFRSGYKRLFANGALTRISPFREFLRWNAHRLLSTAQCWTGLHYAPFIVVVGLSILAAVVISWINHKSAVFIPLAILLWMVPLVFVQRVAPFPRVFNFLFPITAGFASYGLHRLFRKLHIVSGKRAQYVWAAMVIMISGYWGVHRLRTPCGPEGNNQCADGYFVDAQSIVNDLNPVLQRQDALVVAQVSDEIVDATRFYLLEANRQPTLVHAYSPRKGLDQLDEYNHLFVVIRRDESPTPKDGAGVMKMFNCLPEDFDKAFDNPELIASYQMSDLYRLRRKSAGLRLESDK